MEGGEEREFMDKIIDKRIRGKKWMWDVGKPMVYDWWGSEKLGPMKEGYNLSMGETCVVWGRMKGEESRNTEMGWNREIEGGTHWTITVELCKR